MKVIVWCVAWVLVGSTGKAWRRFFFQGKNKNYSYHNLDCQIPVGKNLKSSIPLKPRGQLPTPDQLVKRTVVTLLIQALFSWTVLIFLKRRLKGLLFLLKRKKKKRNLIPFHCLLWSFIKIMKRHTPFQPTKGLMFSMVYCDFVVKVAVNVVGIVNVAVSLGPQDGCTLNLRSLLFSKWSPHSTSFF